MFSYTRSLSDPKQMTFYVLIIPVVMIKIISVVIIKIFTIVIMEIFIITFIVYQ